MFSIIKYFYFIKNILSPRQPGRQQGAVADAFEADGTAHAALFVKQKYGKNANRGGAYI